MAVNAANLKVGSKVIGHKISIAGYNIEGKIGTIFGKICPNFDITWDNGGFNVVSPDNLSLCPSFKVGDRVKITGKTMLKFDCIGEIGTVYMIVSPNHINVRLDNRDLRFFEVSMNPNNIEHYTDPKPSTSKFARILTEKVVINGTKCRKILAFENMFTENELPADYFNSKPSFYVWENTNPAHFEFNGICHTWISDWSNDKPTKRLEINFKNKPTVDVDGYYFVFTEGDIWEESVYQAILKELRAAGTRLATINKKPKEEKLLKSWTGPQTDEI